MPIRPLLPLMVSLLCFLQACDRDPDASTESTLAALDSTNVSSAGFPWDGAAAGVLKRWDTPVPVKTNGEARATAAMDQIEQDLGFTVFDRTSIESTPDDQITRGIVVSVGTTVGPPGADLSNVCGGVSGAPSTFSYPANFLTGNVISARLYVNLDGPACQADIEITVHEFGHALGMGTHFDGFGSGTPTSGLFWRVLQTIFANAAGTPLSAIFVPLVETPQ